MAPDEPEPRARRYPVFWDRAIPIAIAIFGTLILTVLVVVLAMALGLLSQQPVVTSSERPRLVLTIL